MNKYAYAIFHGETYTNGYLNSVYLKLKDAVTDIRAEGYKYNKAQNLYINKEEEKWYRIEKITVNTLSIY